MLLCHHGVGQVPTRPASLVLGNQQGPPLTGRGEGTHSVHPGSSLDGDRVSRSRPAHPGSSQDRDRAFCSGPAHPGSSRTLEALSLCLRALAWLFVTPVAASSSEAPLGPGPVCALGAGLARELVGLTPLKAELGAGVQATPRCLCSPQCRDVQHCVVSCARHLQGSGFFLAGVDKAYLSSLVSGICLVGPLDS